MFFRYLFIPSFKCNLACKYCYTTTQGARFFDESNWDAAETLKKLVSRIEESSNPKECFLTFHGGEPTLLGVHKLEELFKIARSSERIKGVSIQTNATLVNDELIEIFKKYNIDVGVSYDGINSSRVDKKGNPMGLVIRDKLKKLISEGVTHQFITELVPLNKIEDLAEDFADLGAPRLAARVPTGYNASFYEADLKKLGYNHIVEYAMDWWMNGLPILAKKNIHDKTIVSMFGSMYKERRFNMSCVHAPCRLSPLIIAVNGSGDCSPCNQLCKYTIGNIFDDSLMEVFNSDRSNKFKYRYEKLLDVKSNSQCKNCKVWNYCFGGCIADRLNENEITNENLLINEKEDRVHSCDIIRAMYYYILYISVHNRELFDFYYNYNQKGENYAQANIQSKECATCNSGTAI